MSNQRRGRDLIWKLVTHKSSDLEALRQSHFGDATVPTLEQLRDAWKILAHLQLALEIADERRWRQIEHGWRAMGEYPSDDDHLEATAPTEDKVIAPLPFGGRANTPSSSVPQEPHPSLGATQASRPRNERTLPFRAVSSPAIVVHGAPAPVRSPAPPKAPPAAARTGLSLQEYAMLCATRDVAPERLAAALKQFGIDTPQALATLEADWHARFQKNAALRVQYEALAAELKDWLASQA